MAAVVLGQADLLVTPPMAVDVIRLLQLQIEVVVAHSSPLVADWQVLVLPVL
jgi:hypothetical protein